MGADLSTAYKTERDGLKSPLGALDNAMKTHSTECDDIELTDSDESLSTPRGTPSSPAPRISFTWRSAGGATTRREFDDIPGTTLLPGLPLIAFPGSCPNGIRPRMRGKTTLYLMEPTAQETFRRAVDAGGDVLLGVIYRSVGEGKAPGSVRHQVHGFLARPLKVGKAKGRLAAHIACLADMKIMGEIQYEEAGGMVGTAEVKREADSAAPDLVLPLASRRRTAPISTSKAGVLQTV